MKLSPVRIALWVFIGVVFVAIFLPLLASFGVLLGSVFFGWFAFLQRVWPNITVNWNGITTVLVCSVLIIAGLHSLSGWLFASVTAKTWTCPGVRWRWSWTLALYAAVWLLFASIMGAVGVAHQVGWLIRSGEPLHQPRQHPGMLRFPLNEKSINLFVCAEEARWNLETTRKEFLKEEAGQSGRHPNVFEDLHVLFMEGTNGQLAAGLIFHRDPETRAKAGFVAISPDVPTGELQPAEALPRVLARYQSRTNSSTAAARSQSIP